MKKIYYVLVVFLFILVLISGFLLKDYFVSRNYQDIDLDKNYTYQVIEVIDGDTIVIETGNYVRLIGIDAPERNESYYNESKEFLENLVLNTKVKLDRDINDRDSYGRLLRYVYVSSENNLNEFDVFVNILLVEKGYAVPLFIEPNKNFKEEIENAWKKCLEEKINLCS